VALSSGQKLLRFDRKLGARLVAGTDEAGRGSLAGPLVVAGVLLDYGCLRDHKVRPLALLNDSKQVTPEHRAVVDGDEKSAAIAAASIVAKVTRDRLMRRMDALYPQYGFSSHVGYITPGHSAIVRERGPSRIHRRSFQALCYVREDELAAMSA
jgi:ribonuclease HII